MFGRGNGGFYGDTLVGLLNPLGLLNNDPSTPVRVDEVPSGLACNCYCARCGAKFVAVHPETKQWHFRHHNAEDCGGSFETAVHFMAKAVLVQNKCLMLPYLKVRPARELWKVGTCVTQEETVVKQQVMRFDCVEDEVRMDGRVPDIVMWKGSRKLLVEIFVTHDLTEEKVQWIRENDLPTISVNLSWVHYDVNQSILAKCLREGRAVNVTPRFNIVSWVHHPRLAAAQSRVNEEYLRSIQGSAFNQEKPE
jgi:hypothetical protein